MKSKYNTAILIRLGTEQAEELKYHAERAGMTVSAYIRWKLGLE